VTLLVKCPLTVKARVTDRWKMRVAAELQETLRRTEQELAQIEGQLRRLQGAGGEQAQNARGQLEAEVHKRQERRAHLLEQLRGLARLQNGAEVIQGQAEGLVPVRVGDRWEAPFGCEVLLEDGLVVEIRGLPPEQHGSNGTTGGDR